MSYKLLYFPLDRPALALVVADIERKALALGYVTTAGPDTGHGNIAAMLVAIGRDEVTVSKAEAAQR